MSRVCIYLNFKNTTEEAFKFYQSVFGGEFSGGGVARFGDFPPHEGAPQLAEGDKNLILHIELPILGGHVLMGSDAPESFGFKIVQGNNFYINLEPDSRSETDKLFTALSKGGQITQPLGEMFWGGYYGTVIDQFGIQWMFNCTAK